MTIDHDTQEAQERLRDRRRQYDLPDPSERPQEASSPRLLASVLPLRPVDPAELDRIRSAQHATEAARRRAEREGLYRERARALGEVPRPTDDDARALAARVLNVEHQLYPRVVRWFAEGRLQIEGQRVRVDGLTQTPMALMAPVEELSV